MAQASHSPAQNGRLHEPPRENGGGFSCWRKHCHFDGTSFSGAVPRPHPDSGWDHTPLPPVTDDLNPKQGGIGLSEPVILSLGSVNADFQVRVDEPIEEGRTLIATDFRRLGGGKAANVAFLAGRLGHRAKLLARVGDDGLAEQALAPLREAGVDLGHVSTAEGHPTAVSMIAVPPDGKKSILLALNANDAWDEPAILDATGAIGKAPDGSILVADYEVPPGLVARAAHAARERGFALVIDPSPADRVDRDVLARAQAVTANPKETQILTGIEVDGVEAACRAARELAGLGTAIVCVKLRDGGCVLAHDGRLDLIPAPEVEPVDSTGAGDAFAGALAVALLEKRPPRDAACFAVAASSLAVTAYGSQPAYPSRARIEALLGTIAGGAHALG